MMPLLGFVVVDGAVVVAGAVVAGAVVAGTFVVGGTVVGAVVALVLGAAVSSAVLLPPQAVINPAAKTKHSARIVNFFTVFTSCHSDYMASIAPK